MHITLKVIEKLDSLLEEADEYIKCANAHADDSELKNAYMDLARCHYEGFEKLEKCCDRAVERKSQGSEHGQVMKEMWGYHKTKFDEEAAKIKHMMEMAR